MAAEHVCKFYQFGHCKFMDLCRKKHVAQLCENETCEVIGCSLRHPRPCRFYQLYGRCKFEPCSYQHIESKEMNFIKQLQLKLEVTTNEVKDLYTNLEAQKETMKSVVTQVSEFRTDLVSLSNQISSSPSNPQLNILQVENRIKEVESTNYILLHSIDDLEKGVKVLKMKMSKLTSCYECEECDKVFPSDTTLKNHLWRDHGQRKLFIP